MKYAKAIKQARKMGRLNFWGLYSIGFDPNEYKHKTRRLKKIIKDKIDSKKAKEPRGDVSNWYI